MKDYHRISKELKQAQYVITKSRMSTACRDYIKLTILVILGIPLLGYFLSDMIKDAFDTSINLFYISLLFIPFTVFAIWNSYHMLKRNYEQQQTALGTRQREKENTDLQNLPKSV